MSDSYQERVRKLRKARKLHPIVETRLVELLAQAFPDTAAIPEVSALPGGRNDLFQYFFNGRRVAFEVFCSASQVSQDLRLLEQCDAAVKIAVLMDPDVDDSVSTQYFRKKPHAFPYLWLRHVLDNGWDTITVARLRELIDEKHSVVRLRRLVVGRHAEAVDRTVQEVLGKLEAKLDNHPVSGIRPLTGKQMLALQIIRLINKKGVPVERLRSLYHWLVQSVEYAVVIVSGGLQAFLITDLEGRHAIWSDGDLADDLIVCSSNTPEAQLVICLNPILNEFFVRNGQRKAKLKFHFFHSYAEFIERVIPRSGAVKSRPSRRARKS